MSEAATRRRGTPFERCPWLSLLLLLLLGIACGGSEPTFPRIGDPSDAEDQLSWWQTFAMDRVLDYRVWSGSRAGFVALVVRNESVAYARTTGFADLEDGTAMTLDTRFHLASMTKPITAVAAMILLEEGNLSLDDPIAKHLPEFAALRVAIDSESPDLDETRTLGSDEAITVRHLLTFTSGLGGYAETDAPFDRAWRAPDIEAAGLGTLADRIALVPSRPLYEVPGTRWRYGWSADVLARVIEVAAEESYGAFLARRIFTPLRMHSTGYPDDLPADAVLATMYTHDETGALVREPRFDHYYGAGWTPGGGGLVSTAGDYLRFATMLANGGSLEGVRILERKSVDEMTRLHVPDGVLTEMGIEGLGWGLGVCVVADAERTPMPTRSGDFWWSGRFGTQFWVSPAARTVVVVMQQTEPGPHTDRPVTPSIIQAIAML